MQQLFMQCFSQVDERCQETCEGSTMLDGGGSMIGSSGSRRRIRNTAMLSSSMAVTRSRRAIHTGRKHCSAHAHTQNIAQQNHISFFNTNYYLFNTDYARFNQIYKLVSDTWKFRIISQTVKLPKQKISYPLYSQHSTEWYSKWIHCL